MTVCCCLVDIGTQALFCSSWHESYMPCHIQIYHIFVIFVFILFVYTIICVSYICLYCHLSCIIYMYILPSIMYVYTTDFCSIHTPPYLYIRTHMHTYYDAYAYTHSSACIHIYLHINCDASVCIYVYMHTYYESCQHYLCV
jgi:hypothetical protein